MLLDRPRFREVRGGAIIDMMTGAEVATVNVEGMDTATAHRVAGALIEGLHREFGPCASPEASA